MAVVRVHARLASRGDQVVVDRKRAPELLLMSVAALGMLVVPLLHVFTPLVDFADYRLPVWTAWVGAVVFAAGVWLLWRSHAALRTNFSDSLQLRRGHQLVTTGVYARVRHPMYAAFWLVGVANALLLHNWIGGWSFLACFGILYAARVPREERMMLEWFGNEYRAYMRRTGRVLPRLT